MAYAAALRNKARTSLLHTRDEFSPPHYVPNGRRADGNTHGIVIENGRKVLK